MDSKERREKLLNVLNSFSNKMKFVSTEIDLISKTNLNKIIKEIKVDNNTCVSVAKDDPFCITYYKKNDKKLQPVKTTLRRYIRRNLNVDVNEVSDKALDFFGSQIKLLLMPDLNNQMVILSGEQLRSFYRTTKITSCMTGEDGYRCTGLFLSNPDKIKLAVYNDIARALLWICDDGTTVVDKIYSDSMDGACFFQEWINNNNYIYRKENSGHYEYEEDYFNGTNICLSDNKTHKITLNKADTYPFLDTFRFGKCEKDKLILCNKKAGFGMHFICTEGWFEGFGYCETCHAKKQAFILTIGLDSKIICDYCFNKSYFNCFTCNKLVLLNDKNIFFAKDGRGNLEKFCGKCNYETCVKCKKNMKAILSYSRDKKGNVKYEYNKLETCLDCSKIK